MDKVSPSPATSAIRTEPESESSTVSISSQGLWKKWAKLCQSVFIPAGGGRASDEVTWMGALPVADECSFIEEQELARAATKRIYLRLKSLQPAHFEVGTRAYYIGNVVDAETQQSQEAALEGIAAVLRSSSKAVSDEAKAGLLRYITGRSELQSRSEVVAMCLSSLSGEDEQQAVAAARSLGEIGELGVLPQIRHAYRHVKGQRVKTEIGRAVREIESSYGIDASAAERSQTAD